MEQLDVNFANRYLQAFEQFRSGTRPTSSWASGFSSSVVAISDRGAALAGRDQPHINLDLGIAAAVTASGDQLPRLQTDFNQINGAWLDW